MSRTIAICMLGAAVAACSSYQKYVCPDPIGEIVRQDCDDYKVRYEDMKTRFSLSFNGISLSADVGEERLRDPSELLQLLMQQTLALCHDYNACRVRPEEFRRRREQMDRIFTSVFAILEQLEKAGLSKQDKSVLVMKLVEILQGGSLESGGAPGSEGRNRPKAQRKKFVMRDVFDYWFGSRFLDERFKGKDARKGEPVLLGYRPYSERGTVKRVFVTLAGKVEEDDYLVLKSGNKEVSRCPARVSRSRPTASFTCKVPPRSDPRLGLWFLSGMTSVVTDLGEIDLSASDLAGTARIAYQPEPITAYHVTRERPWIIFFANTDARHVTARCSFNDKPLGAEPIIGTAGRTRYGSNVREYAVPLPITLSHVPEEDAVQSPFGIELPGNFTCILSLDGVPTLTVKVPLGKDGGLSAGGGTAGSHPHVWPSLEAAPAGDSS